MPLTIPDDILAATRMSEREALVEIACRLFDAGKLTRRAAVDWAGLTTAQFDEGLFARGIALYRPTTQDLAADLATLDRLGL